MYAMQNSDEISIMTANISSERREGGLDLNKLYLLHNSWGVGYSRHPEDAKLAEICSLFDADESDDAVALEYVVEEAVEDIALDESLYQASSTPLAHVSLNLSSHSSNIDAALEYQSVQAEVFNAHPPLLTVNPHSIVQSDERSECGFKHSSLEERLPAEEPSTEAECTTPFRGSLPPLSPSSTTLTNSPSIIVTPLDNHIGLPDDHHTDQIVTSPASNSNEEQAFYETLSDWHEVDQAACTTSTSDTHVSNAFKGHEVNSTCLSPNTRSQCVSSAPGLLLDNLSSNGTNEVTTYPDSNANVPQAPFYYLLEPPLFWSSSLAGWDGSPTPFSPRSQSLSSALPDRKRKREDSCFSNPEDRPLASLPSYSSINSGGSEIPLCSSGKAKKKSTSAPKSRKKLVLKDGQRARTLNIDTVCDALDLRPVYPASYRFPCIFHGCNASHVEGDLFAHFRSHYETIGYVGRTRPYACPHSNCRKRLHDLTGLSRHIRDVHLGAQKMKCSTCGKEVGRKAWDQVERHLEAKKHEEDQERLGLRWGYEGVPWSSTGDETKDETGGCDVKEEPDREEDSSSGSKRRRY